MANETYDDAPQMAKARGRGVRKYLRSASGLSGLIRLRSLAQLETQAMAITASRAGEAGAKGKTALNRVLIILFLTAIAIPWIIPVGALRMSAYRITLCVVVIPCLVHWLSGRAGPIRVGDFAIILFAFWKGLSLAVLHGEEALQAIGVSFVETLGAYFLARCCIRDAEDFEAFAKALFVVIAALLPLALLETITGWKATLRLFALVLPTYPDEPMMRAGFWRAQGPFEHPILFGVVGSAGFALAFLVLGHARPLLDRYSRAGAIVFTVALSLSAGPLLGIALQSLLIAWKRLADAIGLRLVWLMTVTFSAMALCTSWITGRSLVELVGKLTFDPMSYWSRNLIWEVGWVSVSNHPAFGTGLGKWDRPEWMVSSIDNFWLGTAVTHGLPALLFIVASVAICLVAVVRKTGLDEKLREFRSAYVISVLSWCAVGQTVHLWDGALVLVLFLLGSGSWLLDVDASEARPHPARGRLRRKPINSGSVRRPGRRPPPRGSRRIPNLAERRSAPPS
ncbi:O-antigen ligase family protein [Sinorhizobium meliloti]|uniref:O-antigen ligase family protein n=1 Tax=Rhizobium meliloti TaxID=382 RepID=UPI003F1558E7